MPILASAEFLNTDFAVSQWFLLQMATPLLICALFLFTHKRAVVWPRVVTGIAVALFVGMVLSISNMTDDTIAEMKANIQQVYDVDEIGLERTHLFQLDRYNEAVLTVTRDDEEVPVKLYVDPDTYKPTLLSLDVELAQAADWVK